MKRRSYFSDLESQASLSKSRGFSLFIGLAIRALILFYYASLFTAQLLKGCCHVMGQSLVSALPRTESRYINLFVYDQPLHITPVQSLMFQCGITDEDLVTLSVRDLNRQLKMRGLNRDEIVQMKQRQDLLELSKIVECTDIRYTLDRPELSNNFKRLGS